MARFTTFDVETCWRIIKRGQKDGIEPMHVYYVMSALNIGVDDAMKIINDPDTPY